MSSVVGCVVIDYLDHLSDFIVTHYRQLLRTTKHPGSTRLEFCPCFGLISGAYPPSRPGFEPQTSGMVGVCVSTVPTRSYRGWTELPIQACSNVIFNDSQGFARQQRRETQLLSVNSNRKPPTKSALPYTIAIRTMIEPAGYMKFIYKSHS